MPAYLDNNATTKPLDAAVDAMVRGVREFWHNPSSVHRPGQAARQQVELARQACAVLVVAKPRQLTFTGSGTEAIDLAIRGALTARGCVGRTGESGGACGGVRGGTSCAIITTPIEHAAVRELAQALGKLDGVDVLLARVDSGGVVSAEDIERLMRERADVALVSVQWANNETGAVQPVREIAGLCRSRGVVFHCDATQWVGKVPVESVDEFDLLTFSAHKFHGVKGVGMLVSRAGVRTTPMIHGVQEQGRRGGTENVPGIMAAGVAAGAWTDLGESAGAIMNAGAALRDRFEQRVLAGYPDARINGVTDQPGEPVNTRRLWNTSNIAFPRLEAEALLLLLSERGVCASAGAACSSGSLDPSPVLLAMGIPPVLAHGSLRFSLSRFTTQDEVDEAADIVVQSAKKLYGEGTGH